MAVSEIDEHEAVTRWEAILEQVEGGREFIITRQGAAVARLIRGHLAATQPLKIPPRESPHFDDAFARPPPEASDWDDTEGAVKRMAQATALRDQARAGGLRFEAYLPPDLADWLLVHIARGTFRDPSEAVFVMLGEQEELEAHLDLRDELLRRGVQAAIDGPRPGIPSDEVEAYFKKLTESPRAKPAVWRSDV